MKFKGSFALATALAHGVLAANTTCPTKFVRISADEWVRNAQPGWNLGNTLEATPTEGSWNNPPVVPSTFDYVKEAGFRAVRIPGMLQAPLQAGIVAENEGSHVLTLIPSDLRRPLHLRLAKLDNQCDMA